MASTVFTALSRGLSDRLAVGELTVANGALQLAPGSHHPEQNARLAAYRDRQMPVRTAAYQASFPGYAAATVVLGGITAGQEHQPAEHSDYEQADEADQRERRA